MGKRFQGKHYVARLNFDKFVDGKVEAAKRGLAQAAAYLVGELKKDLSKPGPFPTKVGPKEKIRRQKRVAAVGETHRASKEGEPPRYRTGTLRASVNSEPRDGGMVQRIGTPLKYGFWLEWGTPTMGPRPWLRPGLQRNVNRLAQFVLSATKAG